jgi:uncharacterized protein (UPF0303 family)
MELSKDLEVIARQEKELQLPRFDEDIAWELGSRLRELALHRQLPVAIRTTNRQPKTTSGALP